MVISHFKGWDLILSHIATLEYHPRYSTVFHSLSETVNYEISSARAGSVILVSQYRDQFTSTPWRHFTPVF